VGERNDVMELNEVPLGTALALLVDERALTLIALVYLAA
jgi:hypothetical protein